MHDIDRNGIVIGRNNSSVLIFNDTNITGVGNTGNFHANMGIWFVASNDNVRISDVHINDIAGFAGHGIVMGTNNTATISNTTIANVSADGIQAVTSNQIDILNVQISGAGTTSIAILNDNAVTISNTQITDGGVGEFGPIGTIYMRGENNVAITDTTITSAARHGIVAVENNVVTIANTTITDSGAHGISVGLHSRRTDIGGFNTITISNSTIAGAAEDGLHFQQNTDINTVTMNNTTFTGDFGDDLLGIDIAGNTLSGAGNVFGGTFGDSFCEVSGAQLDPGFGFDVGPQASCP